MIGAGAVRGLSNGAHGLSDVADRRSAAHFAMEPFQKHIPHDVRDAFLIDEFRIEDDVAGLWDRAGVPNARVECPGEIQTFLRNSR